MKFHLPDSRSERFGFWKDVFEKEKLLCRIAASWLTFAAIAVVKEEDFTKLSFGQNLSFGWMFLVALLSFLLYSVTAAVCRKKFYTDSWFLLAAATVCAAHWIRAYENKGSGMLFLLAVILFYSMLLFYVLQRNEALLEKFQPSKRTAIVFAAVCGLTSGIVIAVITCLRYKTFSAPNFDFGLFCNMFHYMKETGLPFVTSERDMLLSHFAVHISPIYYLLLPFYFLFPSPLTLQIGQAVVLAGGIIPLFFLAWHYKLTKKTIMLLCVIYAFYPAISAGCFYDIHENCFLLPLLLWMFYFFEKEKPLPMYLFAIGVLLVKEDAAVYLLVFALYVLLGRKKRLHGIALACMAAVYFGAAVWLLERFGTGIMSNRFDNLIYKKEDGLFGAVKTALVNPGYLLTQLFSTSGAKLDSFFYEQGTWGKIAYFLQMFLPLGMLPFCARKQSRWILMAPILINLLTNYKYMYSIGFQYSFGAAAFLLYAAVLNLPEIKAPLRRNLMAFGAVSCLCFYIAIVLPRWDDYTARWADGKETYQKMETILDSLPKDASLNVSSMLLAHVADRREVYEVAYHGNRPDVDYVVLDARYDIASVKDIYLEYGYQVDKEQEGLILILRRPENSDI